MDERPFSPDATVAEVLRRPGPVARVFIRHRTACVGCSLARFCSLRDVATTYGLDLAALIIELEGACHAEELISQRSSE